MEDKQVREVFDTDLCKIRHEIKSRGHLGARTSKAAILG
jgi:hypothetical protein